MLTLLPLSSLSSSAPDRISTPLGMLFACWAIVIVLVMAGILFWRKRSKFALPVFSMALLPLVHIFSAVIANRLTAFSAMDATQIRALIDMLGGMLSCLLLGISSQGIRARKIRHMFVGICALFLVTLTVILMISIFHP